MSKGATDPNAIAGVEKSDLNRTAGKTDTDDDEYYGGMGGGASGPEFEALKKQVNNLAKGIGFAPDGEAPDWMKPKDPADEDPNLRLPGNLYCKYTYFYFDELCVTEKLSKMLNKFLDEHQKTTEQCLNYI